MRTPLHNHLTACVELKRPRDVRPAMALDLACHAWRERLGREVEAAVDVLRLIRWDRSPTAKAVGRRLRTYLVQVFLLSLPSQRSPEGHLAWLSKPCPAMDREERAQHLLAFSKWVPNQKKKRVRPARQQPATSTPEERRVAFDFVSAAMDEVRTTWQIIISSKFIYMT